MMRLWMLLALAATGCASARINEVRHTFSKKWLCPVERVVGEELGEGKGMWWKVSGCDLRAECTKTKGPCQLVWTDGERAARARQRVVQQTGCPAEQLAMEFRREGVWTVGCGKTMLCPDPTMACVEKVKPGCQDDARWEYEQCFEAADRRGTKRRGNAFIGLSLKNVIGASTDETAEKNACASQRDRAIQLCLQKAGQAPVPQIP